MKDNFQEGFLVDQDLKRQANVLWKQPDFE